MGLFDKLLGKRPKNGAIENIVASPNSKAKTNPEVDTIKQKSPVKESEAEKRSASKWNDVEYLRRLNVALKNNPGKSAMQVISDTEQELADKRALEVKGKLDSEVVPVLKRKPDVAQQTAPVSEAKKEPQPTEMQAEKKTSWIDELADPNSDVHQALAKLAEPPAPKREQKVESNIEITVTLKHGQEKVVPAGELSCLDFGKPAGVLGCFLNYEAKYLTPPTDRALEIIRKNGIVPPDGLTKEDANCILRRIEHDYNREGPEPWLVSLATETGTKFSAYIGGYDLCKELIYQLNDKELAALYAYAVRRGIDNGHMDKIASAFGKMKKDSELSKFYDFADQVIASPSLLKSLKDRDIHDFQHPHRGTSIYKAAARFFGGEI